jgi:hypothetical protein
MKHAKPRKTPVPADERRSQIIGWTVAVGLHLLLLLIAAFLNIGWRYDIPEWVQMEFVSTRPVLSRARPPQPAESPAPKKTPEKKRHIVTLPNLSKVRSGFLSCPPARIPSLSPTARITS